jgi:hypothetical protein
MPRRNRHDEDIDYVDYEERDEEIPRFQVVDITEELKAADEENSIKQSSDSNNPTLSKSETTKQLETFRKRSSINGNGFYNYRMWLFDMSRNSNEKKKVKMLRESILSCFSHLISLNYIPTSIYKQLMYWLDDEIMKDGEIVEKTTYLMDLIVQLKDIKYPRLRRVGYRAN